MHDADICTVPTAGPADVSEIRSRFESGEIDPAHVVGIISQTEGDGLVRGYASQSLQLLLAEFLDISMADAFERIPMMMIGGTAGLMCPHHTLFIKRPASLKQPRAATGKQPRAATGKQPRVATGRPDKRLVLGVANTRRLLPEEYGTLVHVGEAADAVRAAITDAGISDAADVQCVEMKVPHMTPARVEDAASRGHDVVDRNLLTASGMSRGASALGAAVALGEIAESDISDADIGRNPALYSQRASASSGGEQFACRVVVIGSVAGAPSKLVVGRGMMDHQLDLAGARAAFAAAGLTLVDGALVPADRDRIAAVFVNAGANYLPHTLGRRHTMNSDFLATWAGHQAKAVVHAIVAAMIGDTMFLANAGAEHQGPAGANLLCVIAKAEES